MKKVAKMRPVAVILPALAAFGVLCYLPLSKYLKAENRCIRYQTTHHDASFFFVVFQ